MKLPQMLKVKVTQADTPFPGALVSVTLHTNFKNDFSSIWGPADRDGNLTIRRSQLIEEGEKDKSLFIVDYGHPESDFNGRITLKVMNEESIKRAQSAFEQFSKSHQYPAGYELRLKNGLERCPEKPKIEVTAIGSQPTLIIEN